MVSFWPWASGSSKPPKEPAAPRPALKATPPISAKPTSWDITDVSTWTFTSKPALNLPESLPTVDVLIAKTDATLLSWSTSPTTIALTAAAIGGVAATSLGFVYGRYGKRLKNANWITPDWMGGNRWVRGVVTSVGDGDNFRLFHTPMFGGYHWPLKLRRIPSKARDLKDETLHIRLAGVDAPENAHFGKPAQPFAAESLAWLSSYLLHRKVYCQLVRKDQYSRIVANVYRPYRFAPGWLYKGKNVGRVMLQTGHACVYEQAGAEYGKYGKQHFLDLEAKARKGRRGQWASGVSTESPAEYKRRHAQ